MTTTTFKPTHIIKRTGIPCIVIGYGSGDYKTLRHIDTENKGDCWVETEQIEAINDTKKQIEKFVDTCCDDLYYKKGNWRGLITRQNLTEILQTLVETGGETADAIDRLNEMHAMYAEEDE